MMLAPALLPAGAARPRPTVVTGKGSAACDTADPRRAANAEGRRALVLLGAKLGALAIFVAALIA